MGADNVHCPERKKVRSVQYGYVHFGHSQAAEKLLDISCLKWTLLRYKFMPKSLITYAQESAYRKSADTVLSGFSTVKRGIINIYSRKNFITYRNTM